MFSSACLVVIWVSMILRSLHYKDVDIENWRCYEQRDPPRPQDLPQTFICDCKMYNVHLFVNVQSTMYMRILRFLLGKVFHLGFSSPTPAFSSMHFISLLFKIITIFSLIQHTTYFLRDFKICLFFLSHKSLSIWRFPRSSGPREGGFDCFSSKSLFVLTIPFVIWNLVNLGMTIAT